MKTLTNSTKLFATLTVVALLLPLLFTGFWSSAQAEVTADDVRSVAQGIIDWKKSDVGSLASGNLINDKFLLQAGTTPGDWYPIGLGRLGVQDNFSGYLAVVSDEVGKRYQNADKLSAAKATEWHRISLAILASGGNPRNVNGIDLIADGTYNRTDQNGNGILGKQGINGYIWGLITLDSMYYEVPSHAYYTRDDVILSILRLQLADGGWALSGTVSDPDITAMAIQAFAPYYNSQKVYSYTDRNGNLADKTVRQAVNEAIEWLSDEQLPSGDFRSWGMANCESTVQVVVALASIGIDVMHDSRFIKTDSSGTQHTLYDGILKYRTQSGGFTHSFVNDGDNPSAVAGEPNSMASEQTLYGLVSIIRQMEGKRALYDFRAEQSGELKEQISSVSQQIASLTELSSKEQISTVYEAYWQVPSAERRYVYDYYKLADLMTFAGVEFHEENIEYNSGNAGVVEPTEYFDYTDQQAVDNLPQVLTTANRAEVLRLWTKINASVEFEGKQDYTIKLEKAKNYIDGILAEVDSLKADIKSRLYPFNSIGLGKRGDVYELYDRYLALSEYDRTLLESADVEGLVKCKTQVDNLQTALIITMCCATVALLVTVWVIIHVKKRRQKKLAQKMPESDE